MSETQKNAAAVALGKLGGSVKSEAKRRAVLNNLKRANEKKMANYHARRAGEIK